MGNVDGFTDLDIVGVDVGILLRKESGEEVGLIDAASFGAMDVRFVSRTPGVSGGTNANLLGDEERTHDGKELGTMDGIEVRLVNMLLFISSGGTMIAIVGGEEGYTVCWDDTSWATASAHSTRMMLFMSLM